LIKNIILIIAQNATVCALWITIETNWTLFPYPERPDLAASCPSANHTNQMATTIIP